MRYSDAFPSQWLIADDIDGELTVTISSDNPVEYREFKAPGKATPDIKPVLFFKVPKGTKPLILNKTNWKTIGKVLGSDDTDDWAGQSIALFTTEIESFGEMTAGIRVRPRKPQKPEAAKTHTSQSTNRPPQPADPYEGEQVSEQSDIAF